VTNDWSWDRSRRPVKKLTVEALNKALAKCTLGASKPDIISRFPLEEMTDLFLLSDPDQQIEGVMADLKACIRRLRKHPNLRRVTFQMAEFQIDIRRPE
jgi:hypothetical protein